MTARDRKHPRLSSKISGENVFYIKKWVGVLQGVLILFKHYLI